MLPELALYLLAINAVAFGAFGWDKFRAERDMYRLPERTLLTLAAIGGAFGAIFGQQRFRHKTRKEPFRTHLNLIAVLNIVGLAALGVPSVRNAFFDALLQ
ncbi:MAG: DUF1294 domain-containing protein [Parvibaculum sp.]